MASYTPCKDPYMPNQGIGKAAAEVFAAKIAARRSLASKPFSFDGVMVLGWTTMTPQEKSRFFKGEGEVRTMEGGVLSRTLL